jgi:hypothetical protein
MNISDFPKHIQEQIKQKTQKPSVTLSNHKAIGNMPTGRMNKLEQAFEREVLIPGKSEGRYVKWYFEMFKLRLADRTYYTPDFFVLNYDMTITIYEVKGYWQEDARVKFKVAAETLPLFTWVATQRMKDGVWKYEQLN